MERATLLTGIGGQGVQLAARTLAVAAVQESREVMLFGSYGGLMRGGNTDATVVIGDGMLRTPPTVSRAWAAVAMHHEFWPGTRDRIVPGGVVVVDRSVFSGEIGLEGRFVVEVDGTSTAMSMGNARGGAMVMLGALAAATGMVELDSLVEAAREVLPPYRAAHAAANVAAIREGYGLIDRIVEAAWPDGELEVAGR